VPDAHQYVDDREDVGDPARSADHVGDDYRRSEPGEGLQAVEVGAVGAHGLPDEFADVIARLVRIEALDEAERDIRQGRRDENAPDCDGHGKRLRAAPKHAARRIIRVN